MRDIEYLQLLSKQFPNREKTCIEIANLNSILTLPKGTEYFISDIHGEHESFIHLLHAASGIIRSKLKFIFAKEMNDDEILQFANLIYYPEEKLKKLDFTNQDTFDEQKELIKRLILVVKDVSSKYSKSKVRKSIKKEYAYLLDELLYKDTDRDNVDKDYYYDEILNSLVDIGFTKEFIICLCDVIKKLAVDSLHIVGDVFDRGPRHDLVLDELINFHNVDIEWGNHDIEWMGAYLGNETLMVNALRIAVRYNCYDMLEAGYGISLRALNDFAVRYYGDDPCTIFMPKIIDENKYDIVNPELTAKIQKALSIIQFKLEGELIKRHPEYEMQDRIMLERINYDKGTINIEGKDYELLDKKFPTVDKNNPLKLTADEEKLLSSLKANFMHSEKLGKHIRFLFDKGSLYRVENGNLLFHGIIPFGDDGKYEIFKGFDGKRKLVCKDLLEYFDDIIRRAYKDYNDNYHYSTYIDDMYYLWCGKHSPLFGKDKIRTFELYYCAEKEIQVEKKNKYYEFYQDEKKVIGILKDFGLNEKGHIINGHVPVKTKQGESPIKANGRLFVIDGGLSKGYQKSTGIAGYTLIIDSVHITIAAHTPYEKGKYNTPNVTEVEDISGGSRVRVKDTDKGKELIEQINDLKELLTAYKEGKIKEEQ